MEMEQLKFQLFFKKPFIAQYSELKFNLNFRREKKTKKLTGYK
jgi:hypothetical protein